MNEPSLLVRLFPRRQLALRVTLAALFAAVLIVVLKNAAEIYLGGVGDLLGRLVGDLPYALGSVAILYIVVWRYTKTMEALDSKLRSQAQLAEHITDAVVGTDLNLVVTSWNRAAERISGYSAEEAIGKDAIELLQIEFLGVKREGVVRILGEKGEWKGETVETRRDGRRINVLSAAAVVRDVEGTPVGYVSVNSDITERLLAEEALRKSEADYSLLFANMSEGFAYCQVIVDEGGRPVDFLYLKVNDAFQAFTGLSQAAVIGRKYTELFPGYASSKFDWIGTYGRVALEGIPANFEEYFEPLEKWYRISAYSPARGYFAAVFLDVTSRRKTEEQLKESEEKFRSMFESSGVGIGIATTEGVIIDANPALLSMVGFTREEARGSKLQQHIHPDDIERITEARKMMIATGTPNIQFEARFRHKDGHYFWMVQTASSVRDVDGKPLYTVAILEDVTARKEAEEALRNSEEKYRELVEKATSIILKIDRQGRIVSFNEYAERFFGYSRDEVTGKGFLDTITPRTETTGRDLSELMAAVVAHPELYKTNVNENVKKGGERVWVQWNNTVSRDERGNPVGLLCIGTDITERVRAEEALTESEETFRSVLENAPIGMTVTHPDGRWVKVNKALADMLGYNVSELVGDAFYDHLHPEDAKRVEELRRPLIEGGKDFYSVETRWIRSDKSIAVSEINASVVRDSAGKPLFTVAQIEDITQRKEAQEALRESEARFRAIFESAAIGIGIASPDGYNIGSNETFRRMLGYSDTELLHTPILEHVAPEDREKVLAARAPLVEGRVKEFQAEVRYITKGGDRIWVNLTASLVRDTEGKPLYIPTLFEDITERKRAEEALRESEEKFRKAFVVGADAFYVATKDEGLILEINDRFVEMFGYSKEEALGKTSLQLGLYAEPADRGRLVEGLKSKGYVRNLEVSGRRKGGEIFPVLLSVSVLQAEGKSLIVGSIRDITELRKAEEQLREYSTRLEETVRERTRALEEEHDRLLRAERMATVGRVSTQVAHDIRNPLAAINTGLYYLKSVVSKEHQKKIDETVKAMEGSVSHANSIMEDLLDFSRARQFESAPIFLSPVVTEALGTAAIPAEVKVISKLDPSVRVMGDAPKLVRVFVNLLRNAVDAMPRGGTVTISCSGEKGNAVVVVRDTGAGIAASNLPKLFTPFFTTKSRGLGMGLAICKEVVEAHGGTIRVASRVNVGTTFTITLPATRT
jgi:PAS domain S-box-containing protein